MILICAWDTMAGDDDGEPSTVFQAELFLTGVVSKLDLDWYLKRITVMY